MEKAIGIILVILGILSILGWLFNIKYLNRFYYLDFAKNGSEMQKKLEILKRDNEAVSGKENRGNKNDRTRDV